MKISIKSALILTFLILILVPITLLGIISYQVTEEILINKIKDYTVQTMEHANDFFIKYYIEEVEDAVEIMSGNKNLPKIVDNPELINNLKKEWSNYRRFNDNIWYIYAGTEDGRIYVDNNWTPLKNYDPRIRPWYTAAFTKPGEIVWSEPYLELISQKMVVSATKAIYSGNDVVGVFAIDTSLEKLSEIIDGIHFGQTGYAILLDSDGYIVTHPDKTLVGKNISEEKWLKQISSQAKGAIFTSINDESTFVGYVTIPHTNWKLIGFIPETALKNEIEPIRSKTIAIGALSAALAIILSIFISNYLSSIISNLIQSMREVENANYDVRCKYKCINEFSELGKKFNNMVLTISTLIKERKQVESRLHYLSMHDTLTNSYNRTYFEQLLQHLESSTFHPVGIIICDLDGLKLINDTLGHDKGDMVLISASNIIQKSLSNQHKLFRIGGDEFAIVVENCTKADLQVIYKTIKQNIDTHNRNNRELYLSLSIGYALRTNETVTINDVFKEADNMMYKEKLHCSQSKRSAIVKTLMKALEARDYITEGHADRLQNLIEIIAKETNLSEFRINDLRLFAQFHDIGKVGIQDKILFKPAPLVDEEIREMQRHPEIGYRIAMSSPDLNHIADWILKHHERWDGNGYPLGLKGEDIPLECRILSIADTYDAMTSDRPYRKALSHQEAITEIQKCSGTQFDPNLVDIFVSELLSK